MLGHIVAVALQRENLPDLSQAQQQLASQAKQSAWRGWQSVSERPLLCTRTIESSHPYLPSTDYFETVRFPGAQCKRVVCLCVLCACVCCVLVCEWLMFVADISIYFDSNTSTEDEQDWVTIYKDDS